MHSISSNIHSNRHLCHHALTGRISNLKACYLNFECHHCAFDQWLDDIELEFNYELTNSNLTEPDCS